MAFKDANGTITIDEVAAENDIKKIRFSISEMEAAMEKLEEIRVLSEMFKGNTATNILAVSERLKKQLLGSVEKSESVIDLIENTVSKYKKIDADLKVYVESSYF